ncbi:hypothetical protein ACSNOI_45230 [Actinomadura kijaniata]|uniref:hypothetical protein n=1 Tax=Actinomadura kijaniata TaxID=46161 RepID=UPI003F1C941D
MTVATVSALVGLGLALVLAVLGFPKVQDTKELPLKQLLDVLKLVLGTVAGTGALFALVMAYRRQRLAEVADDRDQQRAVLEERRAVLEQERAILEILATEPAGHSALTGAPQYGALFFIACAVYDTQEPADTSCRRAPRGAHPGRRRLVEAYRGPVDHPYTQQRHLGRTTWRPAMARTVTGACWANSVPWPPPATSPTCASCTARPPPLRWRAPPCTERTGGFRPRPARLHRHRNRAVRV